MSVRAIAWAFEQRVGSPVAKLVLVKLADRANDEGQCWPGMKYLEKHTELSHGAIKANIKKLEAAGFLRVIQRMEGNVHKSNYYELNMAQEGGGAREDPLGHDVTQGRATRDPNPLICTDQKKKNKEEMNLFAAEQRKRLGAIFNRREKTAWSDKEEKAFKKLCPIDNEDLWMVERRYLAERKKNPKDNYLRRELLTLLNNWPGEVDKAREFHKKRQPRRPDLRLSGKDPGPKPLNEEEFKSAGAEGIKLIEELRANLRKPAAEREEDGS
jgi:hypothetical protein